MIHVTEEQFNELSENVNRVLAERFSMPLKTNKRNEITAQILGFDDYRTYKGLQAKAQTTVPGPKPQIFLIEIDDNDLVLCLNGKIIQTGDWSAGDMASEVRDAANRLTEILQADKTEFHVYSDELDNLQWTYEDALAYVKKNFLNKAGEVDKTPVLGEVEANTYSDDRGVEVNFNAVEYLAQASDGDLRDLAAQEWCESSEADAVAEHMAELNSEVRAVFDYINIVNRTKYGNDVIGFECHVDAQSAMSWLRKYRNNTWKLILADRGEQGE